MDIGVIIAVVLVVGFVVFIGLKLKESKNKNKKVTTGVGNPTKPNPGVSPEYRKERE